MRNLTDPSQAYQSIPHEQQPVNPFASDNESDAYSFQSNEHGQAPPMPPPHGAYDEAYQCQYTAAGATGDAIPPVPGPRGHQFLAPGSRQSSSSLSAMNSEFDRYPNRISSAAPSISSGTGAPLLHPSAAMGGAQMSSSNRGSTFSDETGSSISSERDYGANPFVVNADFSPFGGYPASSFPLHLEEKEADDYLHNPDPILDAKYDRRCQGLDKRGWAGLVAFLCLVIGGLCIFIVLPVLTYSGLSDHGSGTTQLVQQLTTYEYSTLSAIRTTLVDPDTPQSAQTHTALDGSEWQLVFSDEFNKEGRTFYPGDDQFWTAPDFHYASTEDLEWYTPDALSTEKGTLVLTLDAFKNHDLFYRSGMLQSWNQFCFTQGYMEVSAKLPGKGTVPGLWPGIWTLGNLARPGYKATSDGTWPYSYQACDAGITPNQSSPDGISYLPGQRLNSCTCKGHDHPNPGVGRGAPEIDALEGTVDGTKLIGIVSQSLQVAPMDIWYMPDYDFIEIRNKSVTMMNSYAGGPVQQAISATTSLNPNWYEVGGDMEFQSYGFEYLNDNTDGYIRWFVGDDWTVTMFAPALGPNGNVDQRTISKEPMSIVLNLGISNSWVYIDWPALLWPSSMYIDYVRVYQPSDQVSVTCDPSGFPTYDYIQEHINAYTNPNLTTWAEAGYAFPPHQLITDCEV
ncbi:beta-glucan synthesis-associated protein Kre6p [Trichomonascus vanleenenianus]|uniref:SKN1/KRE6 family beta-glucan synthesis-associated protein n=1 Tax=Trichomonascus vanleenenianus TaxID=2268995 RepID=UPI003EC9A085